jgi:hypothetical protein
MISSNFNGTAIPANDYVWFSAVAKVSGVPSTGATVHVTNQTIQYTLKGVTSTLNVPDSELTFSPTATQDTTTFDSVNQEWDTVVPLNPGSGNVFLGGQAFQFVGGLGGGANPVNWSASFTSDTAGVSLNWQWAAAVYKTFTDYSSAQIKPTDDNHLSVYQNSDHAGTPENATIKSSLLGGARGGGGSNFTGSYSATASLKPTVQLPPPPVSPPTQSLATLAGSVVDSYGNGLQGYVLTLTGTDVNNNPVSMSATTGPGGGFLFINIPAGTNYTLALTQGLLGTPIAQAGNENAGTAVQDGVVDTTTNTQINQIGLVGGDNAVNYLFTDQFNLV